LIIKLCGFTDPEQAADAARLGATHVGLVLWAGSKRAVTDEGAARRIVQAIQAAGAEAVAVVVDHPDLLGLIARIGADRVQLHGDEPLTVAADLRGAGIPFWRAVRLGRGSAEQREAEVAAWIAAGADACVLDAFVPGEPGGTGAQVDLALAGRIAQRHTAVLAGGLTPDNVGAAIKAARPGGVDVASGIERAPGDKDTQRMRRFVQAARDAAAETA